MTIVALRAARCASNHSTIESSALSESERRRRQRIKARGNAWTPAIERRSQRASKQDECRILAAQAAKDGVGAARCKELPQSDGFAETRRRDDQRYGILRSTSEPIADPWAHYDFFMRRRLRERGIAAGIDPSLFEFRPQNLDIAFEALRLRAQFLGVEPIVSDGRRRC